MLLSFHLFGWHFWFCFERGGCLPGRLSLQVWDLQQWEYRPTGEILARWSLTLRSSWPPRIIWIRRSNYLDYLHRRF